MIPPHLEVLVEVWVHCLDVLVGQGLAQQVLVEGAGEVRINQLAIVYGLADDATNKPGTVQHSAQTVADTAKGWNRRVHQLVGLTSIS